MRAGAIAVAARRALLVVPTAALSPDRRCRLDASERGRAGQTTSDAPMVQRSPEVAVGISPSTPGCGRRVARGCRPQSLRLAGDRGSVVGRAAPRVGVDGT